MKIQLLALDLDGTLLNSAKVIPPEVVQTIRQARDEHDVRVVLASARPPRAVRAFYEQLELDTPAVYYNGAWVFDPTDQRTLLHSPLPLDILRGIAELARREYPEVLISAELLDRWYTDGVDDGYAVESAKQGRPDVIAPLAEWMTEPMTKLLLLGEPDRLAAVNAAIDREFTHQANKVQTEGFLLQVMHATVSKAQALRTVARQLGITRQHVMAIGDNANDVGMLQWAGLGVAVANAVPHALAAASVVTASNDDGGVGQAIYEHILHPAGGAKRRRPWLRWPRRQRRH